MRGFTATAEISFEFPRKESRTIEIGVFEMAYISAALLNSLFSR